MFKSGTISTQFAIFNNFTSFYVILSYASDMNGKCMKSYSKVVVKMIFMFIRHLLDYVHEMKLTFRHWVL